VPTSSTNVVIDQGSPNANPSIGIAPTSNAAFSNVVEIGDAVNTTGLVTLSTTRPLHPASWTIGGQLYVGESGTGTINISLGATLTTTSQTAYIGYNANSIGTVTIDGVGSLWNAQVNGTAIVVGDGGNAFLTITNGATVETTGASGDFTIANAGTGTVTVGSATTPNLANVSTLTNVGGNQPGVLTVGYSGNGTLTVNSDGAVSGFDGAVLGSQTGSQGKVIVNGGFFNPTYLGGGVLTIGGSGLGTLLVENGGTATTGFAEIASLSGSAGSSATVTGAGSTWNLSGGMQIGVGDTGSLSIQAGGAVNVTGSGSQIYIGQTFGGTNGVGTATVDNGTLTANGVSMMVGTTGTTGNTLTVQNGGKVISGGADIGGGLFGSSAAGVVTVTGTGSSWDTTRDASGNINLNSQLTVDNPASMTGLVIQQGGQVTDAIAEVGNFSSTGSVNTVSVDGAGSKWTSLTELTLGYFESGIGAGGSTGVVNITNGAQVSAPAVLIGILPDGGGGNIDKITVGSGSSLTSTGTIVVGEFGTAALTISGGSTVSDSHGIIAYSSAVPGALALTGFGLLDTNNVGANSVGTVVVTGAGSSWSNTAGLIVGNNTNTNANYTGIGGGTATATLTVADGGAVSVNGGAGIINVAVNAGAIGTINIGAAKGAAAVAPGTIAAAEILFGAGTGSLVFNHTSTNYSFGTSIQGAGTVDVESGTTVLTATNTYTGATTVNGGTLLVNGSTANSSVTVNANATLGGVGTVGSTAISGGTLAPGSGGAFGPLSVQGSLSFTAASTYLVQVSTTGRTNATGSATLGGASVDANFVSGSLIQKQTVIVNAAGGVNGSFGSLAVTNVPAGFTASLAYDAHDAFIDLSLNIANSGGLNANQQNVANALNNYFSSTGNLPVIFSTLTPAGLTQVSGEVATGAQQATFDAMGLFMGVLTDPFIDGRGNGVAAGGSAATGYASTQTTGAVRDAYAMFTKAPPAADPFVQRWSVWAAGYGGSQTTDGNSALGSNTATSSVYGTAVGADYRFSAFTTAGFALAGGGTNFSVANAGSGRSDLFQAGAFVRHTVGPAYISAALAYGWQDITTNRTVTVAGIDQLRAEFNANAYSGRVEGGYRFVTPWMGITPYAAGQFTTFDLPAYAEQAIIGANTFALAYNAKSVTDPRSELGIRSDKSWAVQDGIFTLRGRLAWAHDFNPDRNIAATFQTLPGATFVVGGAAQAHDSALTTASAEMKWTNGWSAAATFEGEFSDVTRSYAGKGVVRYTW
jgi:T5SS/PEP-CTERM-associated repeat protein